MFYIIFIYLREMDQYSSDSDSEAAAIQQYELKHEHHSSFLHKVEGVALDVGKGVLTEGIVGLI
jgi:hypothetical protein